MQIFFVLLCLGFGPCATAMPVTQVGTKQSCRDDLVLKVRVTERANSDMQRQQFTAADRLAFVETIAASVRMIETDETGRKKFSTAFATENGGVKKIGGVVDEDQLIVMTIDRAKEHFLADLKRVTEGVPKLTDFGHEALRQRLTRLARDKFIYLPRSARDQVQRHTSVLGLAQALEKPLENKIHKILDREDIPGPMWTLVQIGRTLFRVDFTLPVDTDLIVVNKLLIAKRHEAVNAGIGEIEKLITFPDKTTVVPPELLAKVKELGLEAASVDQLSKRRKRKAQTLGGEENSSRWFISSIAKRPEDLYYAQYRKDEAGNRIFEDVHLASSEEIALFAYRGDDLKPLVLKSKLEFLFEFSEPTEIALKRVGLERWALTHWLEDEDRKIEILADGRRRALGPLGKRLEIEMIYRLNAERRTIEVSTLRLTRKVAPTVLPKSKLTVYPVSADAIRVQTPIEVREGDRPLKNADGQVVATLPKHLERELNRWQVRDEDVLMCAENLAAVGRDGAFPCAFKRGSLEIRLHFREEGLDQPLRLSRVESSSLVPPLNFEQLFANEQQDSIGVTLGDRPFQLTPAARKHWGELKLDPGYLANVLWSRPEVERLHEGGTHVAYPNGLYRVKATVQQLPLQFLFTPTSIGISVLNVSLVSNEDEKPRNLVPDLAITRGVENYFSMLHLTPSQVRARARELFANRDGYILKMPYKGYGMYDIFWFLSRRDDGELEKVVYAISPLTMRNVVLYVGPPRVWDESKYLRGIQAYNFYFDYNQNRTFILSGNFRSKLEGRGEVAVHEIEEVLASPPIREEQLTVTRWLRIGKTETGRILKLVYQKTSDTSEQVIFAQPHEIR